MRALAPEETLLFLSIPFMRQVPEISAHRSIRDVLSGSAIKDYFNAQTHLLAQ